MVLAFVITTLTGDKPVVLYHQIYGRITNMSCGEGRTNTEQNKVEDSDRERQCKLNKQHITRVAERVHSEYQFRREANSLTQEEDIQRLNNDDTLPDFEMGHFRVQTPAISSAGDPDKEYVKTFQHVTWMGAALAGFILLCESCENRVLCGQVLKLIVRFLQEHVRVLNHPSEIVNRLERVSEVLERVLPDGNLLFMNHRVVRQIEKELETVMKASA
ncbi:AP-5 complex subunit sigma-1-like [Babylonia areolata]|uniref:AP-5 complex subunit sigma-1-like n=1 Tax=Babylonia areolata TaxID=304850 RepID=UPI003FD4CA47